MLCNRYSDPSFLSINLTTLERVSTPTNVSSIKNKNFVLRPFFFLQMVDQTLIEFSFFYS